MDIRRLKSFITIVDMGSITRAADVLHIAQPALSQQLASIEEHFRQKLLTRSQQGVVMTDAGKVVYRHAQVILRQMEQAQAEALEAGAVLSGKVSVGLAPFSSAATLSLRLMEETKRLHPGILLHITESVSQPYSQMIMNGRLEMGLIHGVGPIRGVKFTPLFREEFVLVVHRSFGVEAGDAPITVADLAFLPFLLPPTYNFVRRAINLAFTRSRKDLIVMAELESVRTIARGVDAGLGATITPKAIADRIVAESNEDIVVRQIASPMIEETLSFCVSDNTPLSEPALAVKEILLQLAETLK
ncbi:LysR family transcriptional regulator [Agrobacterium tumefaciens]|uniref:HTH-type transcriptional regulator TtuA n=1 Tax=Agrobacterium tumefaciens TaxID=358 RepID=A0A2L2LI07_AGRTU|nr:LysR substrate-binding domain-containing protein [Agrobacterium tumefaciens]MBS0257509.1 LysR family transcriptional regulator [Pseudomonadota bacterium]AVH43959.1 LysR family transcriptional regulator [Agrobacterium tumefaciens]NSY97895.1 LysR family transcriptional regulator [Agrobacterium tumefaciens]NSY99681.1 LysR family transcriptional regulator [Agrobacterium tumefaciens]NSZ40675.1 LysR family transcriptional regulator [Agrobacterium tumefaciens]